MIQVNFEIKNLKKSKKVVDKDLKLCYIRKRCLKEGAKNLIKDIKFKKFEKKSKKIEKKC